MKFDYVVGNPPYQEEFSSEGNKTYASPVYNLFLDSAYSIADKVEMIHPARFLFNAGSTPKKWNQKMLNDTHFKVEYYNPSSTFFFNNTEIKGGIAITYRDLSKDFGPIKVFLRYNELNGILNKVTASNGFVGMDSIVISRTVYRLTEEMHRDYPFARYKENEKGENIGRLSKGHDYDMATNIFERLPEIFFDDRPDDDLEYIQIYGRENNTRTKKWIQKKYVNNPKPLFKYSIILPKANNIGAFGEPLSQPIVTKPGEGSTESFLSVGFFETSCENNNCKTYISTKFARALLGILKTTQDLTPEKWKYVPVQNFSASSDIDWSQSVSEIDKQLYAKYGLTQSEIQFIETHVKEME